MIKTYWHPNAMAQQAPIVIETDEDTQKVVMNLADAERVLSAAGFILDKRQAAKFDQEEWDDEIGTPV